MVAIQAAIALRETAACYVRLRITAVRVPEGYTGGACEVDTVVDRVFDTRVPPVAGQALRLAVRCYVPPDDSPTGPLWMDFERIRPGVMLEAYLARSASNELVAVPSNIAVTEHAGDGPDDALWGREMRRPRGWWARMKAWVTGGPPRHPPQP